MGVTELNDHKMVPFDLARPMSTDPLPWISSPYGKWTHDTRTRRRKLLDRVLHRPRFVSEMITPPPVLYFNRRRV